MTIFFNNSKSPFNFDSEVQGVFPENDLIFEENLRTSIKEFQELDYDESDVYSILVLTHQDLSFEKVQQIFQELKTEKIADSIFSELFQNNSPSEIPDNDQKIKLMEKWLKEDTLEKMPLLNFGLDAQVNDLSSDKKTIKENSSSKDPAADFQSNLTKTQSNKKYNHEWTKEETDKMLELIQKGYSGRQVYAFLKKTNKMITVISVETKCHQIKQDNSILYKNYRWTNEQNKTTMEFIRQGWTSKQIHDYFYKQDNRIPLLSVVRNCAKLSKIQDKEFKKKNLTIDFQPLTSSSL